ncbi:hypothetical protein BG011_009282 [Mortierella polycephala]|uniref:Serine/threonine-protein phosphatase 4 regulatory subunit 2 n=1 Tax=Mortierella polycephala TaxID=41804 RepID=A0A9P6TVW3_9FUNG|nr:hypothetical protein BG011_009282 [Mortierella polycephala]
MTESQITNTATTAATPASPAAEATTFDRDSLIQEIAFTNQISVPWEDLRNALRERLNIILESKELEYTKATVTNPRTTTLAPWPALEIAGSLISGEPAESTTAADVALPPKENNDQDASVEIKDDKEQTHVSDQVPVSESSNELESIEAPSQEKDSNEHSTQHIDTPRPEQESSPKNDREDKAEGATSQENSEQQNEDEKKEKVATDVPEAGGTNGTAANVEQESLGLKRVPISKDTFVIETPEGYHERINALLNAFTNTPFTIQRVCELLSNPTEHHSNLIKYLRAVEKVLMITSSVNEFSNPAYSGPSALDGDNDNKDEEITNTVNGDYSSSKELDFSLITHAILMTAATEESNETTNEDVDTVQSEVTSGSGDEEAEHQMEVDSASGAEMEGVETMPNQETEKDVPDNIPSGIADIAVSNDAVNSGMDVDQV